MAMWVRIALAVAVLVVPGALLVLAAYFLARAFNQSYQAALDSSSGQPLDWRAVLARMNVKDALQSARASL